MSKFIQTQCTIYPFKKKKTCPESTYLSRADCTQANTNQRCCDKSKGKVSFVKIARWDNIRTRHMSAIKTIFVAFWAIKQEITRAESFVQKGSAEYNSKELNEWIVGSCAGEWVLQTFSSVCISFKPNYAIITSYAVIRWSSMIIFYTLQVNAKPLTS